MSPLLNESMSRELAESSFRKIRLQSFSKSMLQSILFSGTQAARSNDVCWGTGFGSISNSPERNGQYHQLLLSQLSAAGYPAAYE